MSLLNPVLAVGLEYWEGSNRSCSKGEEEIRQDRTLGVSSLVDAARPTVQAA